MARIYERKRSNMCYIAFNGRKRVWCSALRPLETGGLCRVLSCWRAAKMTRLVAWADSLPAVGAWMSLEGCAAFRAPGKLRRHRRSAGWAIDLSRSYDRDRRLIGSLGERRQERGKRMERMSAAHGIHLRVTFDHNKGRYSSQPGRACRNWGRFVMAQPGAVFEFLICLNC